MDKVIFESGIPKSLLKSRSKLAKEFKSAMKNYMAMLESTKNIDFECEFGLNDKYCFGNARRIACCCSGCKYNKGYLRQMVYHQGIIIVFGTDKAVKLYNKHFNNETGFWREGKGCVLPRKYRSPTCVFHSCLDFQKGKKEKKRRRQKYKEIHKLRMAAYKSLRISLDIINIWERKTS